MNTRINRCKTEAGLQDVGYEQLGDMFTSLSNVLGTWHARVMCCLNLKVARTTTGQFPGPDHRIFILTRTRMEKATTFTIGHSGATARSEAPSSHSPCTWVSFRVLVRHH